MMEEIKYLTLRKDDGEINRRLVKLVQQNPALYDKSHPEYSKREKTDMMWERIAKEIDETAMSCKEKWKNIRTVFWRHVKNTGTGNFPKRKYYLHNELQFLLRHLKPFQINNTINENSIDETIAINFDEIEEENTTLNTIGGNEIETTASTTYENCNYESNFDNNLINENKSKKHKPKIFGKRKRTESLVDPVDECLVRYMQLHMENNTMSRDEDEDFFHSILNDIKTMNTKQKRKFRIGVLNLIETILDDNN